MESTNGKDHKGIETSLPFPNGNHEGLDNPILTFYICKARAIVKEAKPFERISYLSVEHSLRLRHQKRLRRERERSWRGKGRLIQLMDVITLFYINIELQLCYPLRDVGSITCLYVYAMSLL